MILRLTAAIPMVALLGFLILGGTGTASAQQQGQCSLYDPDIAWLESVYDQYSICYTAEYDDDVEFVKGIIDRGKQLMETKYGEDTLLVRSGRQMHLNIMLVPEPNHEATTGTTRFKCCYGSSDTLAQIPYLTPSHSDWDSRPTFGGARLTPNNYHEKTITHEFVHAIQQTIFGFGWDVPRWFSEGQAEYDGMFHTTEYNRTVGFRNLIDLVHRRHRDNILLGKTLSGDESRLVVAEVYFSGSFVLKYLSERFGEEIQLRLMTHGKSSFNDALIAEIDAAGTTVEAEFEGMRDWLDRCYANSRDCDVEPIVASGDASTTGNGVDEEGSIGDSNGDAGDGVAPVDPIPPGVSLSAEQPQAGVAVNAVVADPDHGVESSTWKWESSESGTTGWSLVAIGGGLSSAYTPSTGDVGKFLRATATYRTSDGRTKRASVISDLQVVSE